MKADGEIKIKQGIVDPVFKPLTHAKRNKDKQQIMEEMIEEMFNFETEPEPFELPVPHQVKMQEHQIPSYP